MKIIIFKEKHGNRYFDASTPQALDNACRKILKERLKYGWYNVQQPPPPNNLLTIEEIAKLPEKYKNQERRILLKWEETLESYQKEKQWLDDLKKLLETPEDLSNKKIPESYHFLRDREHWEYEGMTIRELEKA